MRMWWEYTGNLCAIVRKTDVMNHPCGNGLYQLFQVIMGMVYYSMVIADDHLPGIFVCHKMCGIPKFHRSFRWSLHLPESNNSHYPWGMLLGFPHPNVMMKSHITQWKNSRYDAIWCDVISYNLQKYFKGMVKILERLQNCVDEDEIFKAKHIWFSLVLCYRKSPWI